MKNIFKIQLFFLSFLLLLVSCGGGGGGGSASAGAGTLSISLTDSSGCAYDNVFVTIRKVSVHKSSSANDNDSGWIDITPQNAPLKVDLLTLQNGLTTGLGISSLPAGHYTQVRLYLEKNAGVHLNNFVVVNGDPDPHAIFVPSGYQTGIKIIHDFDITDGVTEDLVLDFDPCRSIVKTGNGKYLLKPVITAVVMKIAGSIAGAVSDLSSGAVVKAEIGGVVIKQTTIKSDGTFILGPLLDSNTVKVLYPADVNGTYDVVVGSEKTNTAVTTDVPVTAGVQTIISTTTDPIPLTASAVGVLNGNMNPTSADARVSQIIDGKPYEIARDSASLIDGSFSFTLSVDPPVFAQYSASLPLTYQPDNAAAAEYSIDTPNDAGLYDVSSVPVTMSSPPVHVDFTGVNSLAPASGTPGTVQGALTVASLPGGFTSGMIVISAMMNNENVNSTGIPVSSTGTFSYAIDDLAPGTYTVTAFSAEFGSISPDLQVVVPSTGGTFSGKNFTVSP